jgi:hypothetical protein
MFHIVQQIYMNKYLNIVGSNQNKSLKISEWPDVVQNLYINANFCNCIYINIYQTEPRNSLGRGMRSIGLPVIATNFRFSDSRSCATKSRLIPVAIVCSWHVFACDHCHVQWLSCLINDIIISWTPLIVHNVTTSSEREQCYSRKKQ